MLRILRFLNLVITAIAICLANPLAALQAEAATKEFAGQHSIAPHLQELDNATCLTCHDARKVELKAAGANGNSHPLRGIENKKFGKSVHGEMQCIACHKDITDAVTPHKKGKEQKAECASCHQELWEIAKKENLTTEKAQLGVVVQNIEAYKKTFHALKNKDDPTRLNAKCDDCHDTHSFNVPRQGSVSRTAWHLTIPNTCGEKCHTDELDEYSTSVHGEKVMEEHSPKAAVCTDCHTSHGIANTSKLSFKLDIVQACGECHKDRLESYSATLHGQINTLGYSYTAKCYDCHGSHGILQASDPKSKVHINNRLKTCQQCHNGTEGWKGLQKATPGFVTFGPHANTHDFKNYPQMWIASKIMITLLSCVFAFFWLHTGLWWYREAKDHKARKNHPDSRREKI